MRFANHYTRGEARALLPRIRKWLKRLVELREEIESREEKLKSLSSPGKDLGGPVVNQWVRKMAEVKSVLLEFHHRDIQIKDLDRGLIDFPAILDDKEVFLCWEQDEEDIEFWHDLDAGYAGRERFSD
ncbi:MAG TPA: DUF2203 domain-containing protein [Verrucomicrobiae bacterium]|nr:DUF2203 domain-containing protein [Verrucomicrobiae bacterium]